ncbi:MAG TPA: hypothetical protein VFI47_00635 [Acidimicrobiales bacterium]|nr:hypothetical protein [Acidimicrobiales bacterium]
MRRPSLRTAVAALAVATLVAAGCGDDDDTADADPTDEADGSGTAGGSGDGAYCAATLAVETAPEPEIDFPTATEEEIAAGMQDWADQTLRPLVDDVVAVTPDEIREDIEVMTAAVDQVAAGDPSAFDVPDVVAASNRVHAYDLDTCGWTSQAVEATEYSFADIPDEMAAGTTSFEFSNEGHEVHELILVRRNDGVTETAEELLALPEDEAMAKVTMLGAPAFAPPGSSDYKVVDLEPGDYIAVCFIPMGMTGVDGPPPDGPPHFTQGMVAEFTVA